MNTASFQSRILSPVNTTPEISTSSPTLSARIFSSVKEKERLILDAS